MNICYIAIDYHGQQSGGGIASYVNGVSKELIERGHKVVIVTKRLTRSSPALVQTGNLTIYSKTFGNIHYYLHKIPFVGKRISAPLRQIEWSWSIWSAVRKILKQQPIDMVESQEVGNLALALFLGNIPLVIKVHGATYNSKRLSGEKIFIGDRINRVIERWCLKKAALVVAPSSFKADEICRELHLDNWKVMIVPNPVNSYFIRESCKQEAGKKNPYTLLYTGRVEYRKGVQTLLESMSRVIKSEPNTRLIIAGGSNMSLPLASIEEIIEKEGLVDCVEFKGHIEWEKLAILYRMAAIFVIPSYYETFSISCAEAMVFGLPVVAAKGSALAELVEDGITGLLVPPGDRHSLAEAIVYLLKNPDICTKMGRLGREKVLREFTVEKVIDAMMKSYEFATGVKRKMAVKIDTNKTNSQIN